MEHYSPDILPDDEATRRSDAILTRMLHTPHKRHEPLRESTKRRKKQDEPKG